jgi:hypothetical protein
MSKFHAMFGLMPWPMTENPRRQFVEKMSDDQAARLVEQMTDRMKDMLAGFPPEVQGAMLADLTAIWLAGHAPQVRRAIYDVHMETLWPLVEANEKIIFGGKGHPMQAAPDPPAKT